MLPLSRMGLSAPFFKSGWGDLGVVTFEEAESLLKGWPPEHFDTQVRLEAPCSKLTIFHQKTNLSLKSGF